MPLVWFLFFLLSLYCLLDVAMSDPKQVRNLPKIAWLLIVLFIFGLGAVAWLLGGRPEGSGLTPGGAPSGVDRAGPVRRKDAGRSSFDQPPSRPSGGGRTRPKGPDDDPEFLRKLDERLRRDGGDGPGSEA